MLRVTILLISIGALQNFKVNRKIWVGYTKYCTFDEKFYPSLSPKFKMLHYKDYFRFSHADNVLVHVDPRARE